MALDALPPPPAPPAAVATLAARVDRALAAGSPAQVLAAVPGTATDPVLGGRRARALLALGRHDEAAGTYWKILKTHPGDADAYLGLAWTYLDEGQFGMAHQPLEEGLRLMPSFEPGWRELGRSFYWLKRYDKAVAASDHALSLAPLDPEAWLYKGLALGLGGHAEQALPVLTQASALAPLNPLPRRVRGRLLLDLGRPAQAEVALSAALRVAPGDKPSKQLLIKALEAQGKHWQAFTLWWSGRP